MKPVGRVNRGHLHLSPPVRGRGLKPDTDSINIGHTRRPPCGGAD